MNTTQVTAILRDVIVQQGLPFAIVSVIDSANGWDITVRADSGKEIPLTVADGRPIHVRETIQDKLEAEL
jgi:hypothetical protein